MGPLTRISNLADSTLSNILIFLALYNWILDLSLHIFGHYSASPVSPEVYGKQYSIVVPLYTKFFHVLIKCPPSHPKLFVSHET